MISDIVIKAESLGKKYVIGHQSEKGRQRYTALRDVVVQNAQSYWQKTKDLLSGKAIIEGDAMEEVWALRDINFEIAQGEAVGIIGRNGAGKSTLLKILSRITEPSVGRVTIRGRVASLLGVGTGFHPELSGRDNVYLNGAILGMTRQEIKRKFDEIVAFAGVERYLDTPVKRYSSGMYVRLAFAVAAHLEPEILVVDEVLAVGDAEFQKKCLGKMGDVSKEGRTVLFVSHNMTAINSLCDRSLLLSNGQIALAGDTREVVSYYLRQNLEQTSEKSWSDPSYAPGNDKARLKSARIVPKAETDLIDVQTPLDIEFEFWNFQDGAELNYSLVLNSEDEISILNTISMPRTFPAGIVKGTCHIPGNFLNNGTYSLRILLVQSGRAIFDDKNVLTFEVADVPREFRWFGKWVGLVRPNFEWTTESTPLQLLPDKDLLVIGQDNEH